jgi:hypothetical protein
MVRLPPASLAPASLPPLPPRSAIRSVSPLKGAIADASTQPAVAQNRAAGTESNHDARTRDRSSTFKGGLPVNEVRCMLRASSMPAPRCIRFQSETNTNTIRIRLHACRSAASDRGNRRAPHRRWHKLAHPLPCGDGDGVRTQAACRMTTDRDPCTSSMTTRRGVRPDPRARHSSTSRAGRARKLERWPGSDKSNHRPYIGWTIHMESKSKVNQSIGRVTSAPKARTSEGLGNAWQVGAPGRRSLLRRLRPRRFRMRPLHLDRTGRRVGGVLVLWCCSRPGRDQTRTGNPRRFNSCRALCLPRSICLLANSRLNSR